MGNNYCCAYNEKPGEDLFIESNYSLNMNLLIIYRHVVFINFCVENNINIALKFYQNGKGRDSLASS